MNVDEIVEVGTYKGHTFVIKTVVFLGITRNLMRAGLLPYWHCGYVETSNRFEKYQGDYMNKVFGPIRVHGGLTWGGKLSEFGDNIPSVYGIGFDCNHINDSPYVQDVNYVRKECLSLIDQLIELENA